MSEVRSMSLEGSHWSAPESDPVVSLHYVVAARDGRVIVGRDRWIWSGPRLQEGRARAISHGRNWRWEYNSEVGWWGQNYWGDSIWGPFQWDFTDWTTAPFLGARRIV